MIRATGMMLGQQGPPQVGAPVPPPDGMVSELLEPISVSNLHARAPEIAARRSAAFPTTNARGQ
jgi:hypothetical protein